MKFRDGACPTLSKHVKFGNLGVADCRESPTGLSEMPALFKPPCLTRFTFWPKRWTVFKSTCNLLFRVVLYLQTFNLSSSPVRHYSSHLTQAILRHVHTVGESRIQTSGAEACELSCWGQAASAWRASQAISFVDQGSGDAVPHSRRHILLSFPVKLLLLPDSILGHPLLCARPNCVPTRMI